ncbi:dihydrodipicolinate synthase family protein [Roseobacter cerasinus]|uniref:Dihydrodipicolinate synthase family protein n=1 Tax=Roseobacter cerasinus TaxID=2602289 RepID=A0A640VWG6_9RHOB|nr:dihydrodipicolinate synthase family protein [Roseobacter cerasinus]GFE52369.1 dihydrodipicolinate synthase family protein [Roseobacter cerasinus]
MKPYSGIWPVAPTAFHADGTLDLEGSTRALECMIDQGSNGVCILANYSEQFLLSDQERYDLTKASLEHVAGRVPVIVTISHFATDIAVARARQAKEMGAAIVMMMAPYHGATLKGSAQQTYDQFAAVGEVGIPIMLQDAPLSGVDLDVPLLARMAREIEMLKLLKIESVGTAAKLRALLEVAGADIDGPFDGEEGITLMADLDAGATGTMTSASITDQIKPVVTHHLAGDRAAAEVAYARVLPAINFENRQCQFRAAKAAMLAGGVIGSDFCRHPIAPLPRWASEGYLDLIRPLDPVVLRWGK